MATGLAVGMLLALPGLFIWLIILLLPWRPWSTRETFDAGQADPATDLSRITVLIPARNEAAVIADTLRGLATQGTGLRIILIDDQSDDQTVAIARNQQLPQLEIIPGQPLPQGWSGKLWALEQGKRKVNTDLVLLLDADIELRPGTLRALLDKFEHEHLDMLSLMARLRMQNFWEKFLMPAFIFFFKLLYPFGLANSAASQVAAAAGGCILIKRTMLERTGAFGTLRHCLIDDCALARKAKEQGGRTWLGLTHSAISRRAYPHLRSIGEMVTRTAYTQLGYSFSLLLLCTLLMAFSFILPVIAVVSGNPWQFLAGLLALIVMYLCYLPVLNYYELRPLWGVLLPLAGALYLGMTWASAWRHWFKSGATWKNRNYPVAARK